MQDRRQQILSTHARMIHDVVSACRNADLRTALEPVLKSGIDNGWLALVGAIRAILAGGRDEVLNGALDEDDRIVIEAILSGLRDPSSLPDLNTTADPSMAAPGLAAMISAAASGDANALSLIAAMAEQMSRVGGDMARLAAIVRPLIDGERDVERLTRGMTAQGRGLVLTILEALAQQHTH